MRRTAAIRKSLKNVTDNQGGGYPCKISYEAACQSVSHFFDMSDSEVKGKHINNRLAAAGHGAGSPADEGIWTCDFKDVLQYDKGTAA